MSSDATYMREYRRTHPLYGKNREVATSLDRRNVKIDVLTHYGKDGFLQCCWSDCTVSDVDMLTIDHIEDNGAEHRRQITGGKHRCGGGINFYRRLRRMVYPPGYQTLCANHQWKKEIQRRKSLTHG
jgi:hypothetical protein